MIGIERFLQNYSMDGLTGEVFSRQCVGRLASVEPEQLTLGLAGRETNVSFDIKAVYRKTTDWELGMSKRLRQRMFLQASMSSTRTR